MISLGEGRSLRALACACAAPGRPRCINDGLTRP
jgi:hypothetical protein